MKNIITALLCVLSPLLFSFSAPTADFEGKIVFDISIEGANMPEEAKAMLQGSKVTLYIKESMIRSEMDMAMQNTISISDRKTKTSVTLMDIMGHKYMMKSDSKNENEKTPDVTIKESKETKTIAGYLCKKAEIVFNDKSGKEKSTTVFYSEEISNAMTYDKNNYFLKTLKGMPLEYEVTAENGMTLKMAAKTVSKESVDKSKFEIPTGYKEVTREDLQKEMMQMMQQH